jgi:hypothetical protein
VAWRDGTSNCRVASQPTHTSLRLGAPSELPDPRPGCLLWQSVRSAGSCPRHSRSSDITTFALAERLCGAPDWFHPPGMSRSCRRVRRAAPAAFAVVLRELLQLRSNAPIAGKGLSSCAPCAYSRTHPTSARPWWIASSIYPDLINGRDRSYTSPIGISAGSDDQVPDHSTYRSIATVDSAIATSCAIRHRPEP